MIVVAISASPKAIEQRSWRLTIRTYIDLSERVLHAVFAISLLLSARHVLGIPRFQDKADIE
jgi:hypothetical protein